MRHRGAILIGLSLVAVAASWVAGLIWYEARPGAEIFQTVMFSALFLSVPVAGLASFLLREERSSAKVGLFAGALSVAAAFLSLIIFFIVMFVLYPPS